MRFAAGFGIGTTDIDDQLLQEAVETARNANHVLVFLGLPGEDESEGFDRTHIDLPTNQLVLVHALAEVHDRLIIVWPTAVWSGSRPGGQSRRDPGVLAVWSGSRWRRS